MDRQTPTKKKMKLLQIDSSILGPNSISRLLTSEIVEAQRKKHHNLEVKVRDFGSDPLPHLSGLHLAASQSGPENHSPELQHELALSEEVLQEFLDADIVVIGVPMYNFGIPSQLKAWIDRLAIAGRTFRYTEKGVEGLVNGKKIIIASSRGGFYGSDTPMAAFEHQESYLKGVFNFLGDNDVEFVRAEGIAVGPDQKEQALASAREKIAAFAR